MYGLNIDPLNPKGNPSIAELKNLGVQFVRLSYKDFSSGNQMDAQRAQFYLAKVQAFREAGIASLIILTYETYPGAPASAPASDQVWDSYMLPFVRRAGQLAQLLAPWQPAFQIWNEPDLPPHPVYIRTMSERQYGRMLQRTAEAIKAVDPALAVITAGLASGAPVWLNRVIGHLNGVLPAEAVAIHPYGQRPEPNWPNPTWGFGYVGDLLKNYRQVIEKPVVVSEIGVEHLSPADQAEYLRRFYRRVTGEFGPVVPEIFWFCYSDGMVSPYGLLDAAGRPKPAYPAYQETATVAVPPRPFAGMTLTAIVEKSDYDNMVRNYRQKEDIPAKLKVDGVLYEPGEIAFRGTTSLNFPKKGFKIKFKKKNLYLGHTKRIDLSASYVDKSLIRERLSFGLFAQTRVVTPKSWPVDFTIVSTEGLVLERGLFTGIEHVDETFFTRRGRETGNLYKADGGVINGVFIGAVLDPQPEEILPILYDKQESKKIVASGLWVDLFRTTMRLPPLQIAEADQESYADLAGFITQLAGWDAARLAPQLAEVLDVESYLDWLAVNTLVQSNDTYHKNYFLHNRVEDNKWEIIPWDYDLTWGRNWADYCDGLCDDLSEGTSIKGSAQMTNRLSRLVLSNPTYFARLRSKLAGMLGTIFTEEKINAQIDAFYAEISDLAHLDNRKWPTNLQFDQERARLKDWVRRRRRFLFKELGTTPGPAQLADTVVEGLSFDQNPLITGAAVTFAATVKNIGAAPTGDTVGVAFLVDGQYLTYGLTSTLEAGASRLVKSVSTWRATAGTHTLTAIVDDVNRYPEISEDNNSRQITFQVAANPAPTLSDVVVKEIAFERDSTDRVRLAALVANIGRSQTADIVGVAFFVDDQFVTFGTAPPLPAGETKAIRATQTLRLQGSHKVTAIVDDVNRFPEEQEQNNRLDQQLNFGSASPSLADTIILAVNLGSGRFNEGDPLTFEAQVANIGSAPTGEVVGVAFLVDGQYHTFGTTAAIPAGETRLVRAVSSWRAVAGQHHLTAIVDDVNRYPEISETNNRFELAFQVFKPDILRLPDSTLDDIGFEPAGPGQFTLTATVSNLGAGPTPDVVGVAFFVAGQYRTFGVVPPMAAGATAVIRANQALPLQGRHKITAIVDDINRYNELSHQNNLLERTLNFVGKPAAERRAIWVTRYDWTSDSQAVTPAKIDEIVNNVAQAGFNTIFFQVRGAGDAYYTPGLEPWAARLTGSAWQTLGQNPGWDPLARMLEKAQVRGLEVHAFVNVYAVWLPPANESYGKLWPPATNPPHPFDRWTYGPQHAAQPGQYGLAMLWRQHQAADKPMGLAWGEYLWASPGVDEVQHHNLAVIADLVRRYPLNGVHLDRIRYANSAYSYDPRSNAAAGPAQTAARDQWQRDRVTAFVRQVQQEIAAIRPGCWLSAAVWPYYLDRWGWKLSEGYKDYFQDSKGWLAGGVVDAIAPMMYCGVADDFERWQILLKDFLANPGQGQVYPGIGADYDDFQKIAQRIEAARQAGAPGHAIFSYGALARRNYWPALASGPYAQVASLPPHPAANLVKS
jgi:uncharacterized lipoprotein YddW (UPF0748 family)/spore coat protein CotH